MSLAQRVNMFLDEVINLTSSYKEFEDLNRDILELKIRLNKPLRVAVIGLIKAGKSTLMNALMGEKLLITGNVETTYKVSWFKYGTDPQLTIKLSDGVTKNVSTEELAFWTVRNKKDINSDLDRVKYIEIRHPNKLLQEIELIDTPGLASSYGVDSQNTMEFLGLNPEELNESTTSEASQADAVLYAFSKGMGVKDEDILQAFQGPLLSNASPINALGVLTKVDTYWSSGYENPLEAGQRIVDRYKKDKRVQKVLYNILPVSGIIAENSRNIGQKEINILQELRKVEPKRLSKMLSDVNRFTKDYPDVAVTVEDRVQLLDMLGQYGIYTVLNALDEGISPDKIGNVLYETSGISGLINLIKQHFGNRAFLIKLRFVITRLRNLCYNLMGSMGRSSNLNAITECILSGCEKLESEEHAFAELRILQNYYNDELDMDEEEGLELLQITGEFGSHCEARLGVEDLTPIRELANIAKCKAQKWNIKANEGMNSRMYEDAARVLARSCEIMYYHLSYLAGYK